MGGAFSSGSSSSSSNSSGSSSSSSSSSSGSSRSSSHGNSSSSSPFAQSSHKVSSSSDRSAELSSQASLTMHFRSEPGGGAALPVESWRASILDKLRRKVEEERKGVSFDEAWNAFVGEINQHMEMSLDQYIGCLGNTASFEKTFLRPHFSPAQMLLEIKEEQQAFEGQMPTDAEIVDIQKRIRARRERSRDLKVELFLSSCVASQSWILRRVANAAGMQFGGMHVGLKVDGIVLEWGTGVAGTHLVHPIQDRTLFLSIDVSNRTAWSLFKGAIYQVLDRLSFGLIGLLMLEALAYFGLGNATSEGLSAVAGVCTKYNKFYSYDPLRRNCQTFVGDVLEALEIKLDVEGELGVFLRRVAKDGSSDFIFETNLFLTREQLQLFLQSNWCRLSSNDKKLLLAFKTGFDMKARADPSNIAFQSTPDWDRWILERLAEEDWAR